MAERLAKVSGSVPAGEAFIAGLLHDIGQLAMAQLAPPHRERQKALKERGWPDIVIENTLCGMDHADHAELGAELLRGWDIPPRIIDAVRNHHEPENAVSDTAALLYLCEYANNLNEDSFSPARIDSNLARVSLRPHDISEMAANHEWVQLLARAA
jgi:putative nucleotidyltransferase with HDIG domain